VVIAQGKPVTRTLRRQLCSSTSGAFSGSSRTIEQGNPTETNLQNKLEKMQDFDFDALPEQNSTDFQKLKVRLATHYHLEAINGIYDAALEAKDRFESDLVNQSKELSKDSSLTVDDIHEELSSLSDDLYIAEITTELAGEMMVVALYKTIEISIKKMARFSGLFSESDIKSFYRFADLVRRLKTEVCDIELLAEFSSYNQLRLINNAVKHDGVVSEELAQYPGFTEGEVLKDLHIYYNDLREKVDAFVIALRDEILAAMPASVAPNPAPNQ
jgi:hypothetical protein